MSTATIERATPKAADAGPGATRATRAAPSGAPAARAGAPRTRPLAGIDRRGRITLANEAFRRTFGYAPGPDGERVPLSRFVPLLTERHLADWAARPAGTVDAGPAPVLAEARPRAGADFLVAVTLMPSATSLCDDPDAPAGVVTLQRIDADARAIARTDSVGPRRAAPIALADLLDATLDALRDPSYRLRCRLAACAPDTRVEADPGAVREALGRVIDNACRYAPADTPVALRTRHEAADPDEGAAPAGYVVVTIADRGRGMTRAQQQRAFEPFWRAPASESVPGTGMGLAIARRLVDAQGGWIELRSVSGLGTEVDVWLPAAPRPH